MVYLNPLLYKVNESIQHSLIQASLLGVTQHVINQKSQVEVDLYLLSLTILPCFKFGRKHLKRLQNIPILPISL